MTLSITAASDVESDLVWRPAGRPCPAWPQNDRHLAAALLNRRLVASRPSYVRLHPVPSHQSSARPAAAAAATDAADNFSEELRSWRLQRPRSSKAYSAYPFPVPSHPGPNARPRHDVVQLPVGRKNRNQDLWIGPLSAVDRSGIN